MSLFTHFIKKEQSYKVDPSEYILTHNQGTVVDGPDVKELPARPPLTAPES